MAYATFFNGGYRYCNDNGECVFEGDSSHEFLFEFLAKDLRPLQALLQQYLDKRIRKENLELLSPEEDPDEIKRIESEMQSLHPYCKNEYIQSIINSIGDYLNLCARINDNYKLLQYQSEQAQEEGKEPKFHLDREKYLYYLRHLCPKERGNEEILDKYRNGTAEHLFFDLSDKLSEFLWMQIGYVDDILMEDVWPESIAPLRDEIRAQEAISNMLKMIMDIDEKNLNTLSVPQRAWLYDQIFYKSEKSLPRTARKHLELKNRKKEKGYIDMRHPETSDDLYDSAMRLDRWIAQNTGQDETDMAKEKYLLLLDQAKEMDMSSAVTEYDIDNLQTLLYLEVLEMVQNNTMIRKCRRCGKYFVITNRKVAYCNRMDENGNICSVVGPGEFFQQKVENDEALKLYNRAYKTHFARMKKKTMSEDDFVKWRGEAKAKLQQVRSDELDIDSFQKWLKK